jgi:hypothetical protein
MTAPPHPPHPPTPPPEVEHREVLDRRAGLERRLEPTPVPLERRVTDRRKSERRSGNERRLALQSAADQIGTALDLLSRVAGASGLRDDELRLIDAAMLRLRFAAERMTGFAGHFPRR